MIAHKEKESLRKPRPKLKTHEQVILKLKDRHQQSKVEYVLLVAKELDAAHDILAKRGNGAFNAWCERRLKLRRTTAWKWLRVYHVFGECSQCKHSYQLSALYVLSEPETSKWVRREAREFAEKGGFVTLMRVNLWMDLEPKDPGPKAKPKKHPNEEWRKPKPKRRPSALDTLKSAWTRATKDEKLAFREWANARYKNRKKRASRTA